MIARTVRMLCATGLVALLCALPAAIPAQSQPASSKAEAKKAKKPTNRAARPAARSSAAPGSNVQRNEFAPSASGMGDRHDARNTY